MVEIIYSEYSEQADLVGKSVAEAREQYKPEFDIPGKAQAKLNGKVIKSKLEPKTMLNEGDELSFEVKKGSKKPLLIGALMLALALTGGLFAYTYTTASISGGTLTAAQEDFATIEPADSSFDWWSTSDNVDNIVGRISGSMREGVDLFTITPTDNYTGDIMVKVYLTNAGALQHFYRHFNMYLECTGSVETANVTHQYQLLTLENGEVMFNLENDGSWVTSTVKLHGGSWHTMPWNPVSPGQIDRWDENPNLYCEVSPR